MARGRSRGALALACALVLGPALTGCDGGGSAGPSPAPSTAGTPGTSPSEPPPAPPQGPVELTFGVYGEEQVVAAYQRIADAFTARAPQVGVKLVGYPDAVTAAGAVARASGTRRAPDVFLLDQLQLPRLVSAGALAPLDEALDARGLQFGDDYLRPALTTFSADAQLQCMPVEMSPLVVYFNRRLVPRTSLEARGYLFPRGADSWTWDTFEATARAVAEQDLLGPVKGTWLPPRLDLVAALLRSGGDEVVDDVLDPRTLTLSSEGAVESLARVVGLASDPVITLTRADLARRDAVEWFTAGDLGLFIGTRADLPRLRATRSLDFGVVPLPSFTRSTSVSQATGLCVSAGSDAVDTAIDFVAFAAGPQAARITAATGRVVPSRLDVLTSPAFTQPGQLPRRHEAYADSAKRSQPLPYSAQWPAVAARAEVVLDKLLGPRSAGLGLRGLTRRLARLDRASQEILGPPSTG